MAKAKKITAALTAALLCTASLTSCSDTSYVMTVGDSKINAGIYIYNELTEMSYQMTMMYYQKGIKKDYFDQKVDGKAFDEYLSDYALTATKEYAAVVDKFNELGLTLSDEDIKSINDSISSTWDSQGEFYESEGISKESVKLALKGSKMREELFDHYYAEGGEEAVSDDEMVKYLDDNYLRYKSISFAKTKASTDSSSSATDSSTDSAAAANEEAKAKRDEFLEKAQGVSFDDFDSIIDEYNDYVASKKAADSSSATDSDSSAADSSTASDTDSSTDSSSSAPDPYANEKMMNYGTMDDSQKDTTNGKILKEVSGMSTDVATAYEDDNAYYILIKGDIKGRDTEYAKDNHEDLLKEMKSDEFQKKLTSWVEKLDIKVNNKAIKRYTPKVVYDKQTEYYSKNNNS
ncbi:hypothetical protein [Ruminococcus sp.]|uniref:hypothetical protein n=1 Tax=Ruminococcus sp. TaxID=41978 RepID=UPI003AB2C6D1